MDDATRAGGAADGIVPAGHDQPLDEQALGEWYRTGPRERPWLRANLVASLDGAIEVAGVSRALSGPADQRVLRLLRAQCDALLLGAGTLRAERYGPLVLDERDRAWRQSVGLPEHPTLVVVSGSLDLDPAAPVFTDAPVRPVVLTSATTAGAGGSALSRVADLVATEGHGVDLAAALLELHERGLRQLLCEGGPRLLGGLTAADLVDELCLTVSPLLAGAGGGRLTAGSPHPAGSVRRMALQHVLTAGDMLFLRYRRSPR